MQTKQADDSQSRISEIHCHEQTLGRETSVFNDCKLSFPVELEEKQEVPQIPSEVKNNQTWQKEQEWKLKAEQAKEEADERAEVIKALKEKVAELHVKLNDELHEKNNEKERSRLLKGDNEELQKNLEWHKKQLHECQVARDRFQKELEKVKQRSSKLVSTENFTSNIKERENIIAQSKTALKEDFKSQEVKLNETIKTEDQERLNSSQKWMKEEKAVWEVMVAELEEQVKHWKEETESLSDALMKGEKDHATWMGRIAELQQRLEEQMNESERSNNKMKELEEKLKQEELKRRSVEREREEIRAALMSAVNEKMALDGAVEIIKEDFERVRKSFELMKSMLTQKEKRLSELEATCQLHKNCRLEKILAVPLQKIELLEGVELDCRLEKIVENYQISDESLQKREPSEEVELYYRSEKMGESHQTPNEPLEKRESSEEIELGWEDWFTDLELEEKQLVKQATSTDVECNKNVHVDGSEDVVVAYVRTSPESQSSTLGVSPCCLASMERVDLEWREKHKVSMHAMMKKMTQKIKKSQELEQEKVGVIEPTESSWEIISKRITPFSLLPAPKKFDDTAIMELLGESKSVIQQNNCSMDTLKASLLSLGEEVTSLENRLKFTFLATKKQRDIKAAN